MPETRPGVKFNEHGVCYACVNADRKKTIDWKRRRKELRQLCDKYRRNDGYPDCIITSSGGKDSHIQAKVFREEMGMHPLIVNIYNLSWTQTGLLNYQNIIDKYRCHCISLHISPSIARNLMRKAFFRYGSPTWFWDRCVYSYPLQIGVKHNIPLIVYGENIPYEYGGPGARETYSAKDQITNDVVKPIPLVEWMDDEVGPFEMHPAYMPTPEEIEKLEPIYLSYFMPWDGFKNMSIAKTDGFRTLGDTKEWNRQGYIEDYDQIDSPGYLVHPWLKYPKFGHARTTDVCCYLIRLGYITREYAIQLVKMNDHLLDNVALTDFLTFLQITSEQFWEKVDTLYNKDIFYRDDNIWKLKDPIWQQEEVKHGRHEDADRSYELRGERWAGSDSPYWDSTGDSNGSTSGNGGEEGSSVERVRRKPGRKKNVEAEPRVGT
jgi:N-acetyl sugar amidotransferase